MWARQSAAVSTQRWRGSKGANGKRVQGIKELIVSLFQAIVLLQFNARDEITLEDIKSLTNIGP